MLSGLSFEGHGAFPAQCGMPTTRVVEAVDVFESGHFDLSAGLPVSAPDHFCLEGFEKTLDSCVVIAVAFPAHGWRQAVFSQDFLVIV